MNTLYRKLNEYSESDYYGFHMPGHKRNGEMLKTGLPYRIDITEIEGFDDLHHSAGILKESQIKAAEVYGAQESHYLINGSTVGILSAVLGNTNKGDKVLVARNCHKSVYHAIFMNELNPVYIYPDFDEELELNTESSVSAVRAALKEHSDICAAVIVSPTYDGVISDVEAIAEAVHEKGIPLIVDEAHGAHFGFHPYFSGNASSKGADVVINSLHKTLPSLTQTAVLHMNGEIVNRRKVRRYLDMLQSSSPSYVLMASIDACIELLAKHKDGIFDSYIKMLEKLRTELKKLEYLKLAETEHFDKSKIVISVKNTDITSRELYNKLLNEYHLQMEMVAGTYVLGMTSIGDTEEGFTRLRNALFEIDREIAGRMENLEAVREKKTLEVPAAGRLPRTEKVYTSAEIFHRTEESLDSDSRKAQIMQLPWEESIGHISAEYAYLYPPGSPLIVPGERISQEVADALKRYDDLNFSIEGLNREKYIEVWING